MRPGHGGQQNKQQSSLKLNPFIFFLSTLVAFVSASSVVVVVDASNTADLPRSTLAEVEELLLTLAFLSRSSLAFVFGWLVVGLAEKDN